MDIGLIVFDVIILRQWKKKDKKQKGNNNSREMASVATTVPSGNAIGNP